MVLLEVYGNVMTRPTWTALKTKEFCIKKSATTSHMSLALVKLVLWDTSPPSSWSTGFLNKVRKLLFLAPIPHPSIYKQHELELGNNNTVSATVISIP